MKICSLLFGLPFVFLTSEIYSATITVKNNCQYTIWPATLTGGNGAQLSNTGFKLNPQASTSVNVPSPWTGRLWGRTQCSTDSSGKFTCATGDCGSGHVACNGAGGAPPVTLAEFTIASRGGQDFYDVSLVDGFNVPLSITPQGGSGAKCTTTSCAANINADCPSNLAVRGSSGSTIGCKSACEEYNQPQYCCTGAYNSPITCKPTIYSKFFKSQCPQAYSYAYDDNSSLYSCYGSPNYVITFCP